MSDFVHLHLHSEYSLADGIVRLDALAQAASTHGMSAVALTDLANVHGAIKFYRACCAYGIKPLIGCDAWVENPLASEQIDRMILLCLDNHGYQNLSRLLTEAHLRGRRQGKPVINWAHLREWNGGLLGLLDDQDGALANASNSDAQHDKLIGAFAQLFGDRLYLQISRVHRRGEEKYIARAKRAAHANGVGLVATNRVEFISESEFDAHEIRICINDGRVLQDPRRPRRFTESQHLKTGEAMAELFADAPEAIENTAQIARRCNVFFDFDQHHLPAYPDAGDESVEQILRRLAEQGLRERLDAVPAVDKDEVEVEVESKNKNKNKVAAGDVDVDDRAYTERLDMELSVIEKMGYPGYFLIVADFIRWAKQNGIPVGPGRGSGAGSLVAWATGITEINPLQYGLLFERFLNPERVSLPDFDIDFCVDGRDRVIEYVTQRYGRDQVAQIITFGTMAAKAVVRDVGRVMGMPYGFVDQVAKLIPFELQMTLDKALAQEEALAKRYRIEPEIQTLIDSARQLEGIARNAGKHAGGVVIAPSALSDYAPLYADAQLAQAITQWDKDDLEAIGLVKFDFLGLRTLTIIESAVTMINEQACDAPPLDIKQIPLDDAPTYKLIQKANTTAIFQIESRGVKEIITRLLPDKFDDLVALMALYRPGPLQSGMVEDFIDRKHGRQKITYPHAALAPILESTYGVILYQEQVMQIAQTLAGYSIGASDLLRQAMGKKKTETMKQQRAVFRDGAVARDVPRRLAEQIFDLMEKFAAYGFNKSHSVAYAQIAYHTAWLKTHHPAAFMAATLSSEMNTDKIVDLLADCDKQKLPDKQKLTVKPPDINICRHGFHSVDAQTISFGLGAIKGIGKNVSELVESERARGGAFEDVYDLCRRLDPHIVTKRVIEVLAKSGALDAFVDHKTGLRASLVAGIADAMQAAEQRQQTRDSGQIDIFGEVKKAPLPSKAALAEWNEAQILAAEKETLGLYFSGHPYTRYRGELAGVGRRTPPAEPGKSGLFAGLVTAIRITKTRRGKMAIAVLDNADARVEVRLYAEKLNRYRDFLKKENVLIVFGEFGVDELTGGAQMRADAVADLDAFRAGCLRSIRLTLSEQQLPADAMQSMHDILSKWRGGSVAVTLRYQRANGETGDLQLGKQWRVQPKQTLFDSLAHFVGADNLSYEYDTSRLTNGAAASSHANSRMRAGKSSNFRSNASAG